VGSFTLTGTTHTDAGSYLADAWSFAGGTNYNDKSGTVDNSIGKADAAIVVTPYNVVYNGSAHTATAAATGIGGASVGSFTLTGTTHTDAGTYAADAWSFAGGTNYNDASGTVGDSIAQAGQTIAFAALADRTVGDPAFALSATATSGLPVSFSAAGNCTVTGNLVTLGAAGNCSITASQAGNVNFSAAAAVSQSFTINPAPPTGGGPLVNPGPQTNHEGDEVELDLQLVQTRNAAGRHEDNRPLGVFTAANLPEGLHLEKEHGVIRGHVAKNSAGDYGVVVTFTQGGTTFSQAFTWTILRGDWKDKGDTDKGDRDNRDR
jgi:Putative Ig domain